MRAYGPAILRLIVGTVFVAHGLQKLLGIWGGPGIAGTVRMVQGLGFGYAYPLATLLIVTEVAGGALLFVGWGTLWVTLALLVEMGVAVWKVHYRNGFFMNWTVTPGKGHGIEYSLVLIGALLCLMLTGPGALAVDERRSHSAEGRARSRARMRKV
ncbi:MAG TPA: DoxX family protein [Vicinamibacterales bacterium]